MKIILLFIFFAALQSFRAQAQLKESNTLQSPNGLVPANKNYIESYWRAETNRRIFANQFHKQVMMSADDYAKDFVHFSNGQILYSSSTIHLNAKKTELTPGQLTLNNVTMVLGELMDTFFMQYGIANKTIY